MEMGRQSRCRLLVMSLFTSLSPVILISGLVVPRIFNCKG